MADFAYGVLRNCGGCFFVCGATTDFGHQRAVEDIDRAAGVLESVLMQRLGASAAEFLKAVAGVRAGAIKALSAEEKK